MFLFSLRLKPLAHTKNNGSGPVYTSHCFAQFSKGSVSRLAGAGTMEALKQVVPEVPLGG